MEKMIDIYPGRAKIAAADMMNDDIINKEAK